jgi:hypothetical protein
LIESALQLLDRNVWPQGNSSAAWKLPKSATFMDATGTTAKRLLEQLETELNVDELAVT